MPVDDVEDAELGDTGAVEIANHGDAARVGRDLGVPSWKTTVADRLG